MALAILSLGSCLGDSIELLAKATDMIGALPGTRLVVESSLYETEAVDVPDEFMDVVFLNSAVAAETSLSPEEFSDAIHGIEKTLGRVRGAIRHAPRTIDIDIVAFGDLENDDPALTLPHPEAAKRRFVMAPLAEILPSYILPGQDMTASEILATLPQKPSVRRLEKQRGERA